MVQDKNKINKTTQVLPNLGLKTHPKSYKEALLMKADTGASGHYIGAKDTHKFGIKNLLKTRSPKLVQLLNEELIESTHELNLAIPKVSPSSTQATVFPKITNSSLLSIGKLCDDNCIAIFSKNDMKIVKDKDLILTGKRNLSDGLWDVELDQSTSTEKLNVIIQKKQSKEKLALFYHRTCFSPCISTFAKAIKNGNFASWPGLQDLHLYKYLSRTMATAMGHLDQERQGLQSTKVKISTQDHNIVIPADVKEDFFPTQTDTLIQVTKFIPNLICVR